MTNKVLHWLGLGKRRPTPPLEAKTVDQATIQDVTDATFVEVVLQADRLVVVDFWAEWCQPCQIMSAYVTFLAQEFGEQLLLAALDVDENSETPAQYDVMGLPTLLLFHQGTVVDRIVGIEPYEQIRDRVAGHL